MTRDEALTLTPRQTVYHATLRNADSSPLRARVNGQIKTWKRDNRIHIPMKHGINTYFYLTLENLSEWLLQEPPIR